MTEETKAPESGAETKQVQAPAHTTMAEFAKVMRDLEGANTREETTEEETPEDGVKPPKKSKPKDLKAIAETLGVAEKDVYAVEIPSSRTGEKPYTIGALKDLAAKQDEFAVSNLKLHEDRQTFERERVTAETELREILQLLPKEAIKPEAMQKLRDGIEKKHARERVLMLEHIAEWKDETVRKNELAAMGDFLKGYGIPETFLLANFDHNVMRFVRDNMRRAAMVKAALAAVEERSTKTPPRSKSGGVEKKPAAGSVNGNAHSAGRVASQVAGFKDVINSAASRR